MRISSTVIAIIGLAITTISLCVGSIWQARNLIDEKWAQLEQRVDRHMHLHKIEEHGDKITREEYAGDMQEVKRQLDKIDVKIDRLMQNR